LFTSKYLSHDQKHIYADALARERTLKKNTIGATATQLAGKTKVTTHELMQLSVKHIFSTNNTDDRKKSSADCNTPLTPTANDVSK